MKLFSGVLKSWALGKQQKILGFVVIKIWAVYLRVCLLNQSVLFLQRFHTNVNVVTIASAERKPDFMLVLY